MAAEEILGGFFAGASIVVLEYLRHRKTKAKMAAVVAGVEHATRELADQGDKDKADLVKMHIRSIAVRDKIEKSLNIDVKKIQSVIEALAEAAVSDDPTSSVE